MTNDEFCKIDTAFYGDVVDNIKQIRLRSFTGEELKEYVEAAINYTHCCESVKGEQVPTFDEFIDKFNLEVDRDNEYFFDGDFFDAMGLYYKYAEHYGINP
jgi:hypothetical protein